MPKVTRSYLLQTILNLVSILLSLVLTVTFTLVFAVTVDWPVLVRWPIALIFGMCFGLLVGTLLFQIPLIIRMKLTQKRKGPRRVW